jgi:hypothetical protein
VTSGKTKRELFTGYKEDGGISCGIMTWYFCEMFKLMVLE